MDLSQILMGGGAMQGQRPLQATAQSNMYGLQNMAPQQSGMSGVDRFGQPLGGGMSLRQMLMAKMVNPNMGMIR